MDYAQKLTEWYDTHKRDMPWRKTSDPYKIWVSEIMLQQTQVETVKPYYKRFIERFPTLAQLAEADLEEVYTYWQGLGYYRRANNLHKGAKMIVEDFAGVFPIEPKEVKKIPGIGSYTLGAVLSIAFHIPLPAVDGNVMRILARQFLIDADIAIAKNRRVFEDKVMELMPKDPNRFNQALMELGALICTPKNPKCSICPVQALCSAYEEGVIGEYPVKSKKEKSPTLYYKVILIQKEDKYWIKKRSEEGLLAGLWGFPMIQTIHWTNDYTKGIEAIPLDSIKHVFTHRIWEMNPVVITYTKDADPLLSELICEKEGKFVTREEMNKLPIGTAFLKVIEQLDSLLNQPIQLKI